MDATKKPSIPRAKKALRSETLVNSSLPKSSKTSCESISARVFQTELARFCPRKLFYIFLVVEEDERSALLLDDLVNISKNYEEVSSLTFITRDDALTLLDATEDLVFPNQLKPLLLNVIDSIREQAKETMALCCEAQLLKLKLIQVMYQKYVNEVKKNEKSKALETLLNNLSKECKRMTKKAEVTKEEQDDKTKSPGKEGLKAKKDEKTLNLKGKDEDNEYTSILPILIEKDGISFEENIFDYIWFYCIKGYYNAEIIQMLIDQANVPVCAVVKISDNIDDKLNQSELLESFWKQIKQYFFGNTTLYNSFESTIIMQFKPTKAYNKERQTSTLEEYVFMLRRIVNIKLTYLKYLRHLKIIKIQHSYAVMPLECLKQYNKCLRYMPSECINPQCILDAILREVSFNLESKNISNTSSITSLSSSRSSKSLHCVDPLYEFYAFASNVKRSRPSISNLKTDINSFLVHHNNILTRTVKSYKYVGSKIAEITYNFLKRLPVFCGLDNFEATTEDISHLHDIDPSMESQLTSDSLLDHFMHIFLFNKFSNKMEPPSAIPGYELLKNLIIFDIAQFWDEIQTKFGDESIGWNGNLYDTSMIHFCWKQDLSRNLLLQEIHIASHEFLYVDRKYSPETDEFLIVFSDKLDDFGINTKIFNVVIRTPICLRDFCRYTLVADAKWLQENKTEIHEATFKVVSDETCPGPQKVNSQLKMFEEYSYLLDETIKEEIQENIDEDFEHKVMTNANAEEQIQKINFLSICKDLENYPSGFNTIEECGEMDNMENKPLLAYDFGTNVFKVSGNVTTFCSHDNVKVTVDNTGFLQYPEKCSFNVFSEGNILTLYSNKSFLTEPYIVTLHLKDDSRISFITINKKIELKISDNENEEETNNVVYEPLEITREDEIVVADQESNKKVEQFVHCVDEEFIKGVLDGKSVKHLSINDNYEDLENALMKAKENNATIYKVNTTSNYLKRLNTNLKVPVENALRNIIHFDTKEPKTYETYTKRFGPYRDNKSDLEIKCPVDFRICLPNGLFIRTHSCVVDTNNLMIKQEYVEDKPDVSTVQHEEFRLFSNQGLVLIKKIDGTITILKANGDIINFEKPTDGSNEKNTMHSCRCSTLDDYRNKLNKLLKDQDNCDYSTSRRGHITTKQNQILDSRILKVLEDFHVPYIKKSVTKFDGKRIKIQGDKITQKHLHYLTSQQDFFTGEIFFERSDDFRSMFDKYASQKNIFPDGTIISNSIDVADELIDDFVYVTLSYQYEHPYYATVKYNFDKTAEVRLNTDVVVKQSADLLGFTVILDKELSVSASNQNFNFKKTCAKCQGSFEASFNVKPFQENSWVPSAEFMHVTDSYGKHFYSDFIGNCSRNSNYCKGPTNSFNCNHCVETNYKKLFVIKKDLTGDMFYTDDYVKNIIIEMEELPNVSVNTYNRISNENITVVDCRQKFFIGYPQRFFNNCVDKAISYFGNSIKPKSELYTTFMVFQKMIQSRDEIATHISNMQQIFFTEFLDHIGDTSVYDNISLLINGLEIYFNKKSQAILAEEETKRKKEEIEKKRQLKADCSCVKKKLTVKEKMIECKKQVDWYRKKINKNKIPVYFKSEFCNVEDKIVI